jgi:hypothetical protein
MNRTENDASNNSTVACVFVAAAKFKPFIFPILYFEVGSRIFSSPRRPDWLWGPSNEYRGLLPRGVKRPGREADHSPPASAEVKKIWIYTSTPPIRPHVVALN